MKEFVINQTDYAQFYKDVMRSNKRRVLHALWLFPLWWVFLYWLLFYIESVHDIWHILASAFGFIFMSFTAFYFFQRSFKVTNKDINEEKNKIIAMKERYRYVEIQINNMELFLRREDRKSLWKMCDDRGMTDPSLLMHCLFRENATKEKEILQSMMWIKYFNEVPEKTFWRYFTSWKWMKK